MSKKRKKMKNQINGENDTRDPGTTRWIYLCLGLAGVVAVGAVLFLPHSEAGPPKISLSETVWNFGRTPQQSRVSHTFWIKNVGGDTLRIIQVKPG